MSLIDDLIKGGEEAVKGLRIEESSTLDYKKEYTSDREFGKDISSFANSEGGIIIYGILEDNGKPVEFPGVDISEPTIRSKEQAIERNISPPLHVRIEKVELSGKENIGFAIFDIPYSLYKPHMVTTKKECRYYHRHELSSVPMSDFEVAQAFETRQRMRDKAYQRYTEILGELTKVIDNFYYFIGCPIPPLNIKLPIFGNTETRRILDNFVYDQIGIHNPEIRSTFIEYGHTSYPPGYYLFDEDGTFAYVRRPGIKEQGDVLLDLPQITNAIKNLTKMFLSIVEPLGLIRVPYAFFAGTQGLSGSLLIKSINWMQRQTEAEISRNLLKNELYTHTVVNLSELTNDFDSWLKEFLTPIRRDFGFDE
jgi:hypothetical protein